MATPEVIDGKPILLAHYSPATWNDNENAPSIGPGGGQLSGWTFLHALESLPENASLYFFDQVPTVDPALKQIIGESQPGTYHRDTSYSPFEADSD